MPEINSHHQEFRATEMVTTWINVKDYVYPLTFLKICKKVERKMPTQFDSLSVHIDEICRITVRQRSMGEDKNTYFILEMVQ